ncbi:iron-sulfur cluster assembly scaffold protein [Patescibacteria group bacterium]|nr:iron-sulfur cluster assembly scaffold protein [Patescibacteria group bacterium]
MNYSKKVMRHFRKPHNVGKIKDASGVGEVGNLVCGDMMKLYIKVKDEVLTDVKFETYGCAAAIATSSVITDLVKGKKIAKVLKMSNKDIIEELGGLPPIKIHCSLLSVEALMEALWNYHKKEGKKVPKELEKRHEMIAKVRQV